MHSTAEEAHTTSLAWVNARFVSLFNLTVSSYRHLRDSLKRISAVCQHGIPLWRELTTTHYVAMQARHQLYLTVPPELNQQEKTINQHVWVRFKTYNSKLQTCDHHHQHQKTCLMIAPAAQLGVTTSKFHTHIFIMRYAISLWPCAHLGRFRNSLA